MKYYRNNLADELYKVSLDSTGITLNTKCIIGENNYKNHINFVGDIMNLERKRILNLTKNYDKYNRSIIELKVKFEKLNFSLLTKEEYNDKKFFARLVYRNKRFRNKRLNKKYKRLRWKYFWCLPEDERDSNNELIDKFLIK